MTWYDVLGVLPGAEARKIKQKYDAKAALLRPELISGAPPDVVTAQGDVTPPVRTVKRWWFEADAWRDPQAQREFPASIPNQRPQGHSSVVSGQSARCVGP